MLELISPLVVANESKIVLVSVDGLSGLPRPASGLSELETARLPHLSALAARASCGLLRHVAPGISPGSVPGHLGLFGYDPLRYSVGLGIPEAAGIGFVLHHGDVAARGNFCTIDGSGVITDRRAGRITTDVCARHVDRLRAIRIPGVEVFVEPVREHRFVLVLRGEGLSACLSETDPQRVGKPPLAVRAIDHEASRTAEIVNAFVAEARRLLGNEPAANMVLLRGFGRLTSLPRFPEIFGLRAATTAGYGLGGLARLLGMEVLKTGRTLAEKVATVGQHWDSYDFFFVHYKDPDRAGEDGDFDEKVRALEHFDAWLPEVEALGPDVLVVTGDHSTPSILATHGWQPVPVLLASRYSGDDPVSTFTERACAGGSLGILPAHHLMPLVMAHALRLIKFGA